MKSIWNRIKALVNSSELKGKIFRSGSALALGSLTENVLRFVRNIILVRILAPEAFGLMAILMTTVQAIEAFTEVGLKQSLIQNKNGSEQSFLNITWFLSFARGLTLYFIAFLISPLIVNYYNKPELLGLMRIGFLVILLNGAISPKLSLLQKELRFKEWVVLMQGSAIIGIIITIIGSFIIKNVWALLFGFVIESSLKLLSSFVFYPIKPNLQFNIVYFRDIMKYSRGMFGLPILTMIFYQIDIFVVGKVTSVEQLGIYTMLRSLAEVASTFTSKVIEPILFPILASMQDNKAGFRNIFYKTTKTTAIFVFPFTAMLIVFSQPILHLVYGPIYSQFSVPFGILSAYALVSLFFSLFTQVFFSIGQPNRHRIASFARTALFILLIYPATKYFGLTGASAAVLIATGAALLIQLMYVRKFMNLNLFEFTKSWLSGLSISLIIIVPGIMFMLLFRDLFIMKVGIAALLCLIAWFISLLELRVLQPHISLLNKINNAINKIINKAN
jgi:lipopolysaccharide exporter